LKGIWDIGAIGALFALSNDMANITDMRPNEPHGKDLSKELTAK
jgi:hypothetical protein